MRKIGILLTLGLVVSLAPTAQAATNPKAVTAAFTKALSATDDSLEALELKYESDIDALDAALAAATKSADSTLDQDLLAATNLYAPQIAAANKKADDAKVTYEANNKVLLTTGFFGENDRLNWALDCLPPKDYFAGKLLKRYCGAVDGIPTFGTTGFGGEDWQKGDITTIALRNAEDKYVAIGIEKGYLVPVNLVAFDTSRIGYKQALADSANLTALNGKARVSAKDKRDRTVAAATKVRESALADLDDAYETTKAQLEAQETAANLALLAAKRASKDAANFDSAFVVAYKFEYNRQMVNKIADATWTGDWTYRTIDSIIKVNRLAVTGDSIASRYTKSAASSFNSTVGNAFTNEPDFRAALKVLTSIYKKTTNTTLKF
ncbi:hypothetical protein MCETARE7_00129 [Candidatus Nanopelagicaceae bacterium]